jgi:hypothetical protein
MDARQRRTLRRDMERVGLPIIKKASQPTEPQKHPAIRWAEVAGIGSIGIGGAGIVTISFWWGVGFVYAGIAALLLSLWLERFWFKWVGIAILLTLGTIFSCGVTFRNAPLVSDAMVESSNYEPGVTVSGITWDPNYTYLRVNLNNDTDLDFDGLDLTLEPDVPIAQIHLLNEIPNLTLHGDVTKETANLPGALVESQSFSASGPDGKMMDIPMRQIAAPTWRIQCPKLSPHTSIELAIAVADVDPNTHAQGSFTFGSEGIQRPKRIDTVPIGAPVFYRKKSPTSIKVSGSYVAFFKARKIDQTVRVSQLP